MDKKRTNILFIGMVAIAIVILIGTGAYAYYRSTISGTTSGTIARWSFKANNQTESFDLNLGKLYPGKTGTYNIELSAENSDLDVYYELYFTDIEIKNQTESHIAWNSHLYFDSDYRFMIVNCEYTGKYGIIPAGEKITIPLYYNWPYNSGYDEELENANGTFSESFELEIMAQQYTAYSGTIPMKLFGSNDLYQDGYIYNICPQ